MFQGAAILPPSLAVSIESSISINFDVLAAPFPEHDRVLEWVGKGNTLPVRSVVGELDLPIEANVDIVEEGQIQGLADDESLVGRQVERPAVVRALQGLLELRGDIVRVVATSPDGYDAPLSILARGVGGLVRVLLSELQDRPRDAGGQGDVAGCGEDGRGESGCHGGELHFGGVVRG